MKKKASKAEFKRIMPHHDVLARKFHDVWACQFCHRLQYKSDALPDYMIVRSDQSYLVEVKQSNEHWSFADKDSAAIRDIQRQTMDAWEEEHNPYWLFLVLGAGRVPDGHSEWVLSWSEWKKIERRPI